MLLVLGIFLWGFIQQIILGIPFGNNPASDWGLILFGLLPVLLLFLLFRLRLTTIYDTEGISLSLTWLSKRRIAWEEVGKAYIRKYNPIREYGGWGLRISIVGKGKAYTMGGRYGLQLELRNGSKVLIGTDRPEELRQVLRSAVDCFHSDES